MSSLTDRTAPLARLDGPLNAVTDFFARHTPWMWWPVAPPQPRRHMTAEQHVVTLVWSVASSLAFERLIPPEHRTTGARLWRERGISAVLTLLLWVAATGAWNRRADRLRLRPWRRA